MLSWFFKKRDRADAPTVSTEPAKPARQPLAKGAAASTAARSQPAAAAEVDWPARLRAATGDDAALLVVAQSAPSLAIKTAAVQALATEGGLRQAERAFRSHDRKVHRLAKQRLEAAVAGREARASAETLLQRTAALMAEAEVPINHLVELDRDWQALPAALLEPDQRDRFLAQRARLDSAVRERGEAQQRVRRWTADTRRSLVDWQRGVAELAAQGDTNDVALQSRDLLALRASRPDVPATAELDAALALALHAAARVEARLAWFDAQRVRTVEPEPAAAAVPQAAAAEGPACTEGDGVVNAEGERALAAAGDGEFAAPAAAGTTAAAAATAVDHAGPTSAQRWHDLPPLPDGELARILDERHARWLHARRSARPVVADTPSALAVKPSRPTRAEAPDASLRLELEAQLQQAEVALAEGQIGGLRQHLQAIDVALGRCNPAALPEAWRSRHQALRAESARLKGWQQWGGARARDDLAAEAEELARQTLAARDAAANDAPKLNLKHHADSIQALRVRWKELDRLGAAASQALWQRFDAALQTAFQPVAAQHAARKAAREENLAAREALLAGLEALPLHEAAAQDGAPAVDARALGRELGAFQLAWRQLGPIEHTVPAAARDALQQRLRLAVERIDAPLQSLRQAATAVREQLIARAEALTGAPSGSALRYSPLGQPGALMPAAGPPLHWPDAQRQVRELQAEWQDQARRCPLPRAVESGLWDRFRAATDAVFAQRDAESAARDAALAANLAACEALLERLAALGGETPMADVERTLADVDRAWRQGGELPRGAGDAIEARFRAARAAASRLLGNAARRRWEDQCEALAVRLAWCEEREGDGGEGGVSGPPWAADGALPAVWDQALALRWSRPVAAGPLPEAAVDELLLRLEVALDLPTAPAWQDARRKLKLQALKDAMEGRGDDRRGPARQADGLPAMLRQCGLTPVQRERLHGLVAALRQAPPGSLGAPPAADGGAGRPPP